MKGIKKLIALLLVLVMALSVLGACSSGDSGSSNESNSSEGAGSDDGGDDKNDEGNTGTYDGEITKLTVSYMNFSQDSPDLQLVQDTLNEELRAAIGVELEILQLPFGTYSDQLNMMLTGNEELDLMMIFTSNAFLDYAAKGQLTDLTEYIEQYPSLKAAVDEAGLKATNVNGGQYAIPNRNYVGNYLGLVFDAQYEEDLIASGYYGNGKISRADITNLFAYLSEQYPDRAVVTQVSSGATYCNMMMRLWGVEHDDYGIYNEATGEYESLFHSEYYEEMVNMVREWYQAGYLLPSPDTNQDAPDVLMEANQAMGVFNLYDPNVDANRRVVEIEQSPVVTTTNYHGFCLAVPSYSPNADKVVELLNYFAENSDAANLFQHGIEGVHYEKADETSVYTTGTENTNGALYYNVGFTQWVPGIYMINDSQLEGLTEATAEYHAGIRASEIIGFSFDQEPVKTQITAVANALSTYRGSLENGTIDPDEYLQQLRDAVDAAGYQDIITERNAQLAEWKAAN